MKGRYRGMRQERDLRELVVEHLAGLDEEELRSLAAENDIDISGLAEKSDMVDAIALYPGIARILDIGEAPGSPEDEEADPEVEEVPPPKSPKDRSERREGIERALKNSLDFSELAELLSEAATRFGDGGYDGVLNVVRGATEKLEKMSRRFLEASWAYAIASVQRMLETSDGSSSEAEEAWGRFEAAEETFENGNLAESTGLLDRLILTGLELHSHEMERAREDLSSHEALLADVRGMGGHVTQAAASLAAARDALDGNDRSGYLKAIAEVDRLLASAKETRIGEIREAAEAVSEILEEARSIGADVEEASNLLAQVQDAIGAEDFVSAHELVGKAELASLESQKAHMDKVVALRERQLADAKELMVQVKPLLDRAKKEGFQTEDALADLRAAAECVQAGDYVNALMRAKRAHRRVVSYTRESGDRASGIVEPGPPKEDVAPPSDEVEEKVEEPLEKGPQEGGAARTTPSTRLCPHCGSERLNVGKRGKAKCLDCGQKFKVPG